MSRYSTYNIFLISMPKDTPIVCVANNANGNKQIAIRFLLFGMYFLIAYYNLLIAISQFSARDIFLDVFTFIATVFFLTYRDPTLNKGILKIQ